VADVVLKAGFLRSLAHRNRVCLRSDFHQVRLEHFTDESVEVQFVAGLIALKGRVVEFSLWLHVKFAAYGRVGIHYGGQLKII